MSSKCFCGDCQFFSQHKITDLLYGKVSEEDFKKSDGQCLRFASSEKHLVNFDTSACYQYEEE